jgi:hypothetical protein
VRLRTRHRFTRATAGVEYESQPIRYTFPVSCARVPGGAASGHAAAAPPRSVMNSRRRTRAPPIVFAIRLSFLDAKRSELQRSNRPIVARSKGHNSGSEIAPPSKAAVPATTDSFAAAPKSSALCQKATRATMARHAGREPRPRQPP